MINFVQSPQPENLSLKAKLAWEYFFNNDWLVVQNGNGEWIVLDEKHSLNNSSVFPDDDAFIDWLESTVDDSIADNSTEFFRNFCTVQELIDDDVSDVLKRKLNHWPS